MVKDRVTLEKEFKELETSYKHLVDANIKLQDEKKWAIEDKKRLQTRIDRALAYINAEKIINDNKVRKALEKYESVMTEILENDFYE